ncbi:MAG: signal peptidase I [Acidimicrobiales bacterium]
MSDPQALPPDWPATGSADSPAAGSARRPPAHLREDRPSGLRSLIEWIVIIAVALLGALVIRTVLFQAFFIPSESMKPTLKVHDRILVNKLSYSAHSVHRGDIVVFKRSALRGVSGSEIKDLVKRVVGLPGETVTTSPDGQVLINDHGLTEPYVHGQPTSPGIPPIVIPPHHYWVMGDNRLNSADSRVFGPIDEKQIVGRAFIIIWPVPNFGFL